MTRLDPGLLVDDRLRVWRSWMSFTQQKHRAHRVPLPLARSAPVKEDCIRLHDTQMLHLSGLRGAMEGPW